MPDNLYNNPNPTYVSGVLRFGSSAGPGLRAANARNQLSKNLGEALERVLFDISVDMTEIITATAQSVTGETGVVLEAFAKSMKNRWTRRVGMAKVNQRLGQGFQSAVVSSYRARRGNRGSYRQGDRYSGQVLLRALESPRFFAAQPDGLLLINKAYLDKQARQWYRLNFGAGPRYSQAGTYPVIFPGSSASTVALTLRRYGPSANFMVPPGVFADALNGEELTTRLGQAELARRRTGAAQPSLSFLKKPGTGVGQPFIPLSHIPHGSDLKAMLREQGYLVEAHLSKGIKGENFFDAGLRHLAEHMPKEYLSIFDEWLKDSVHESRGPAYKAGITGPAAEFMRATIQSVS